MTVKKCTKKEKNVMHVQIVVFVIKPIVFVTFSLR